MPQFWWIILAAGEGKQYKAWDASATSLWLCEHRSELHSARCHSTAATCYGYHSLCRALPCCIFTAKLWVCLGFPCLGFWIVLVLLAVFTIWDFLKFCFQAITNFSKFLKAGQAIQARCLAFNLNQHSHSTVNALCSHITFWRITTALKPDEGQCCVTKGNNSQKYFFLLVEQDIPGQTSFSL